MNEVVIILGGALCVALAVALIVGGARSRVGSGMARVTAIVAGFLVLALGLLLMTFGLPRNADVPYLMPTAVIGALALGWAIGYGWGEMGRKSMR